MNRRQVIGGLAVIPFVSISSGQVRGIRCLSSKGPMYDKEMYWIDGKVSYAARWRADEATFTDIENFSEAIEFQKSIGWNRFERIV